MIHSRRFILTFHGIGSPSRRLEPGEADVWVTHQAFSAILDVVAPRDDVTITFDDGNASDLEFALPALAKRGLSAVFFIPAGFLDKEGYLSVQGVRALVSGGMVIGSHGMNHMAWPKLPTSQLLVELSTAREILEAAISAPVPLAACPFGCYNRRVLHLLRGLRYDRVFTSDRGWSGDDAWLQPRNTVHSADDEVSVTSMLSRHETLIGSLISGAKLVVKKWV